MKHSQLENEAVYLTTVPLNMWARPGFRGRPRVLVKRRLPTHSDAPGLRFVRAHLDFFSLSPVKAECGVVTKHFTCTVTSGSTGDSIDSTPRKAEVCSGVREKE